MITMCVVLDCLLESSESLAWLVIVCLLAPDTNVKLLADGDGHPQA